MKKNSKINILCIIFASLLININVNLVFAASTPTKVSQASIKASSIGAYSMSLKWTKAKNARSYKIAFRCDKKHNWKYKITNSNSIRLENTIPRKEYLIKIQSLNGKKASGWTSVKKFKTKTSSYNKTLKRSSTNKHVIGIVESGWVTVTTNTHITEYYKYEGNYKKFGYRCYGTTFKSSNSAELLDQLSCNIWAVKHYIAYRKNGKTKYKEVKCNVYPCTHDHIYGKEMFQHPEKDSTSVVKHKKGSSGYITFSYYIQGPLLSNPIKTVKFSNIAN